MKKFSFALLASFALFACNDSNVEEKDSSLTVTDTSFKPVTPLTIADTLMSGADSIKTNSTVQVNPATGGQTVNLQTPNTPVTNIQPAVAPAIAKNAKGLNPAHGQPGHRCDIAVGAPLNSPAGKTAAPVVTQSAPQVVSSSPTTVPTTITPAIKAAPGVKVNPPHGQPGHDCSVQVGAPLKG